MPFDGGTTNRAGARHGPREIRNQSSFMRRVHHVTRIAPYDLVNVADVGDAPVNPLDLMDSLRLIEAFYRDLRGTRSATDFGRRRSPGLPADPAGARCRRSRSA